MDESRKPGDAAPDRDSWQKDEGPAENLGATGVFGAVPESELKTEEVAPPIGAFVRSQPIQEPVVHKVGLAGGAAGPPIDLLERLRTASPLTESFAGVGQAAAPPFAGSVPGVAPSPPGGTMPGQSSEGFTQLIRALTGDVSPSAPGVPFESTRPTAPGPHAPAPESGFTSLLRTLNPDDSGERTQSRPEAAAPMSGTPLSEGTRGFTALFQGSFGAGPDSCEVQAKPRPVYPMPDASGPGVSPVTRPFTPPPAGVGSEPGTLTQFFSALPPETINAGATSDTSAYPGAGSLPTNLIGREPVNRPSSDPSSFTQLISAIGEKPSAPFPYRDDQRPVSQDFSVGRTPLRDDPLGSPQMERGTSSWMAGQPTPRQPEAPLASGGLTQLLRTLDEPAKLPENPSPYPPRDDSFAPSNAGSGGSLTQPYRVDNPTASLSPTSPPYPQPAPPAVTQWGPMPSAGVAPISSSGPSEVTRLLDMSKMREMQRLGLSGPGSGSAAQPLPQPAAQPPQFQPPNLQWPQQPQVPPAPGMPQYPPAMQMPPYAQPAPPQMPAPAPVTAPAAPAAMGKMQQYLPLLLIIIIFLLVVILVTVVFLLKH